MSTHEKVPACSSVHRVPKAELHIAFNSERSKAKERQRYVLLCCAFGLAKAVTASQKKPSPIAADMVLCLHVLYEHQGIALLDFHRVHNSPALKPTNIGIFVFQLAPGFPPL